MAFAGIKKKERESLERLATALSFEPGATIVEQGRHGQEFAVITSGVVAVEADGERVASLGPGDFFGEIALLDASPRTAAATAIENSTIIGFYRPDLMDILKTKPALGGKILLALSEVLAVRLRSTNGELVKVSRKLEGLLESGANE